MWYRPGPNFGYTIVEIDGHPWRYLLTMKELVRLEPGAVRFTGPGAAEHEAYWKREMPELFLQPERKPLFVVDTSVVHPHRVESQPRKPFQPWHGAGQQPQAKPGIL